MKLRIDNMFAYVMEATDEDHMWLDELLAFDDEQARVQRFVLKMQGRSDTRFHLYDQRFSRFPTGLVPVVKGRAKQDGLIVQVEDSRTRPPNTMLRTNADLSWLFDFQMAGVEKCLKMTRGIVWVPTGGGKGEMITGLTQRVPCRWGIVINSMQLVDDIANRIKKRFGEDVGMIGEGKWDDSKRITCATFQTLYTQIDKPQVKNFLASLEGFIVDEVHTLAAGSYAAVASKTTNAFLRFGFSGTPLQRGDKRSPIAIGSIGPVIFRITARELIERGIIAEPTIVMTPVVQTTDKVKHDAVYASIITHSELRNRTIVELCRKAKKPLLCFVKHTDHGHRLNQALNVAGVPSEFIWGDKNTPKRKAAIERLVRGDIDAIVCSVVFNTGIDIPELRSLVLAAGGKSAIATLQRVGRGVRAFDKQQQTTKSEIDVYDILDIGNKMMERHTRARLRAYGVEDFTIKVTNDPHGIAIKKLRMKAAAFEEDAA